MYYTTVQILENMEPIDHEWNRTEEGLIEMDNACIPPDQLARVKYSIGMTVNLGDYQSARVDVGVELPSHVDDIQTTYDNAVDFCNEKLLDEVANLQTMKKGK